MSELEPSATTLSRETTSSPQNDNEIDLPAEAPHQREGLPRSYRMRADAHYVDQLESRQAGPAIRLIGVPQIDAGETIIHPGLDTLTRSIATHGILQPLLVRRHNSRYVVIAGRRRLAAAVAAGLTEVPCVVHAVEHAEAEALAQAENVRFDAPNEGVPPLAYGDAVGLILKSVAVDLASIGALARGTKPGAAPALHARVSAELIQAEAWRAAWFLSATTIGRQSSASRAKSMASILERVKAGFEPESKLTKLRLDCSAAPNAVSFMLDEDVGVVAITGGILATLAWLETVEEPRIDVRVVSPNPRTVRIEVVQRLAPAPPDVVHYFREPGFARPGDLTTWLAVQTIKSLAAQHGGSADFTPIGDHGTVIQSTFHKPDAN